MSYTFRILLIIISLLCNVYVLYKVRRSNLRIERAIFWLFFSLILVIMAAFPRISEFTAKKLGVISPANLVFAVVIFVLLIKEYVNTLTISDMEEKIDCLAREIALEEERIDSSNRTAKQ